MFDLDETEIIDEVLTTTAESPVSSKSGRFPKRRLSGLENMDSAVAVNGKKLKLEIEKMTIPPFSPASAKPKTPPQSIKSALSTPTQSPRTPSNKKRVSFSPAAQLSYANDPINTGKSPLKIIKSSPKVYANKNAMLLELTPNRPKPSPKAVANAQDPVEISVKLEPKAKAKLFSEREVADTLLDNYEALCKQVTDPTLMKLRERLLKFYRE